YARSARPLPRTICVSHCGPIASATICRRAWDTTAYFQARAGRRKSTRWGKKLSFGANELSPLSLEFSQAGARALRAHILGRGRVSLVCEPRFAIDEGG